MSAIPVRRQVRGLPTEPPPIAPDFEAPARPLPSAERVGVDNANQLPLTLEKAVEMALQNNNNIDISRNNVQVAEFNLRGARGDLRPADHLRELLRECDHADRFGHRRCRQRCGHADTLFQFCRA